MNKGPQIGQRVVKVGGIPTHVETWHRPLPVFSPVGVDGNAFALMGTWKKAARRCGWTEDEMTQVLNEARGGDYNHLIMTLLNNSSEPIVDDDE